MRWHRSASLFEAWASALARSLKLPVDRQAIASAWLQSGRLTALRVAHAVARERWIDVAQTQDSIRFAPDLVLELSSRSGFGFAQSAPVGDAADPRLLEPTLLWDFICAQHPVADDVARRVAQELEDSRFNLGLCLLAEPHRRRHPQTDPRRHDPEHRTLLGHPWHPMTKTRLGLGLAEHVRHAPELLAFANVRAVDVSASVGVASPDFAERVEPLVGRAPAGFLRIPVHPAQYARLPRILGDAWGSEVRPVTHARVRARALLSLRTVAVSGMHLKLAIDAHTTSARRLVSTMSVANGPAVSGLLRTIAARDPQVARLDVAFEDDAAGLRFEHLGARAHQLGCILRDGRPFEGTESRAQALVCAGLDAAAVDGEDSRPIEALCDAFEGSLPERAAELWRSYVDALFVPCAHLLFRYGVSLEPHLQNTLVRQTPGGTLRFVVRDLGGIRLHRPRLAVNGLDFEDAPGSFIATDDLGEVRNKFAHTLLHAHAHSVIGWLEHRCGLSPRIAWQHLAERLQAAAAAGPPTAAEDLAHLRASSVAAKCLFVMRIVDQSSDYVFTDVDNPLASSSA